MRFDVNSPIWTQLVDEWVRRIAAGRWRAGERIPGVRELALELEVNPNTVQRSLAELDRRGITIVDRAKGRYVSSDAGRIDELKNESAKRYADEFVRQVKGLGIGLETASRLLEARWRVEEG